jgi:hypothetical protein
MSELTRLLGGRGVRGGYKPFTSPPWSGGYPFRPRDASAIANVFSKSLAFKYAGTTLRAGTISTPLRYFEDRRLYHPEGVNAWPKSKTEKYPRYIDKQKMFEPLPIFPDDPFFPVRKKPKPASIEPHPRDPLYPLWRLKHRGNALPMRINSIPMATWERPLDMVICLKRKIRREMIHVVRRALGSKFKPRSRHMTQFSYVRCS